MRKRNRLAIIFIFLVSLALLFLVQSVGPYVCEVYSDQKVEKQDNYPTTPEGVVRAFVQANFDGESNEVIGDVRKGLRYTTWGDRYPSSDVYDLALRYDVIKWIETPGKATVKVVYQCIGSLPIDYDLEKEEKEEGKRRVYEEIIYYELLKEKGIWKINSPADAGCISVNTGIKILQHEMAIHRNDPKKIEQIKKNIDILRKYL